MKNYFIIVSSFFLVACSTTLSKHIPETKYEMLSEDETKIERGKSCTSANHIDIIDVFSEARTSYKEQASNKAGRIAQNLIKFVPPTDNLEYSIKVEWNNKNGKGVLDDSGLLTQEENESGQIFWRFSLPGTYRLFWTLKNGGCEINILSGFTVGYAK